MATAVGVKESTVSPPSSPKPRAKSEAKSVEPEPERKPEPSKRQTPEPDAKQREPTPSPAKTTSESKESILDREGIIDMEVLEQILELDEPDNHEFSMGMAWAYFDQAKSTFGDMDAALTDEDLPKLSSIGHFLKGSSAALGIIKVRESCESIQHYGEQHDEEGEALSKEEALKRIRETVENAKVEFDEAEEWLRQYYKVIAPNEEPPSF